MALYKKHIQECLRLVLTVVPAIALFGSCTRQNPLVIREEALQSFSVIHVHSVTEIVLVQDTCYKIIAEGEEDVINDTGWEVINDTLRIRAQSAPVFRIDEIPRLTVHFQDLKWLTTFKPAKIYNYDTLRLDHFYIYSIGEIGETNLIVDCNTFGLDNSANTLGKFFIKGRAGSAYLFNRYGSTIVADSLVCSEAQIINESVGDVYVSVTGLLRVYLWGTGNIFYHGNPEILIVEKRNSGELVSLN
ncbi:MAG: DUF2807 domain-containing protein [Bacteroidales bacterium]